MQMVTVTQADEIEGKLLDLMGEDYDFDNDTLDKETTEKFVEILKSAPRYATQDCSYGTIRHIGAWPFKVYNLEQFIVADIIVLGEQEQPELTGFGENAFVGQDDMKEIDEWFVKKEEAA